MALSTFMQKNSNDQGGEFSDLSQLLRSEGRLSAPLPPGFQDRVWHRIHRRKSKASAGSFWETLASGLDRLFARPALSASFILIWLIAGLAAGWTQGRQDSVRMKVELERRYVQSVDPYQNPGY